MKEETHFLLDDLYISSGIPFWIFDEKAREIAAFPSALLGILQDDMFLFALQEMEKHRVENDLFFYYIDDNYYLCMCRISDGVYLLSVPLTSAFHVPLPLSFLRNFINENRLQTFTHFMTEISSIRMFHASRYINLIKHLYSGGSIGEMRIHRVNTYLPIDTRETVEKEHTESPDSAPQRQHAHISTSYEEDILYAVERGDVHGFFQAYFRPTNSEIGQMSHDPLRQQRYQFIIQLYAISRAAIRGGMNPEEAFQLSDTYAQKMDLMTSAIDIASLSINMGSDYCQRVLTAGGKADVSPLVNEICEYVRTHLYEEIRMEDLAEAMHLNRRSLTIHFQKEMGMTIPNYILRKKIEEARYLLTSSDISQLQISELLCFSSQSHFIQKFRQICGITPGAYKSTHHSYALQSDIS